MNNKNNLRRNGRGSTRLWLKCNGAGSLSIELLGTVRVIARHDWSRLWRDDGLSEVRSIKLTPIVSWYFGLSKGPLAKVGKMTLVANLL